MVNEASIASQTAFGTAYGRLFFKFCRQFARFTLNKVEFALLCALKFFTNDRPLLIERNKVLQIQTKYIQLLEYFLEQNHYEKKRSSTLSLAHILLSLIKLRAIDILTAERMLNIVTANEKMSTTVEGYITEVLHREYLNVTSDIEVEFPSEAQKAQPILNPPTGNTNMLANNNACFTLTNNYSPIKTGLPIQPKTPTTPNMTMKPQVIKLQPFIPGNNVGSPHHQLNTQTASALSPHKPVIYVSQSPSKANKLIKINSSQLGSTITPPAEIKTEMYQHGVDQANMYQICSSQGGEKNFIIQSQQQMQNQQQQMQQQQPQVLNLVLVTDSVNGGVSYLSLVP